MLESITNISECEDFLNKQRVNNSVSFIGQLELTEMDANKLRDFIYSRIRRDVDKGLELVLNFAPSCLAFLLVNEAVWNYKQGQYWSLDEAFPDISNATLQNKLGSFFLDYINSNDLNHAEIEGAHRFVGPILLHAGIPQSCLPDFFEEIVVPLLKMGIASSHELKSFLAKIRQLQRKRMIIHNEINEMMIKFHDYDDKKRQLTTLIELHQQYNDYENKLRSYGNLSGLPEDFEGYRTIKQRELLQLKEEMDEWDKQRTVLEAIINLFGPREQALLDSLPNLNAEIERLQQLEEQEKNRKALLENLNTAKQQLSLELVKIFQINPRLESEIVFRSDKLLLLIEAYYQLKESTEKEQKERAKGNGWIKRLAFFIMGLFGSRRSIPLGKNDSDRVLELRKGIEETLREIYDSPLKKELFLQSHEEFSSLVKTVASLTDCFNKGLRELHAHNKIMGQNAGICELAAAFENEPDKAEQLRRKTLEASEAQNRRKNAYLAKVKLNKTVIPALKELTRKKQSIERELQEKERIIRGFGNGDLEAGVSAIQELKSLRQTNKKIIGKIRQLERLFQISPGSGNDVLAQHKREISTQLTQLKDALDFKQKELSSYPTVYPYVDEPIRRFLLYGGDWAEDFLAQSVKLVKLASDGQFNKARAVQLPERVISWFEQWWPKRDEQKPEKGEPKGERSVAPTIVLDPVYKRIKLAAGKMRFLYHDQKGSSYQSLSLVVTATEGTTVLAKTDLRAYLSKDGIVETLPAAINLDLLKDEYQVEIYSGDALLRSWTINGLGSKDYFLVFSEDGKKQDIKRLRKNRYWFILNEGIVIAPSLRIIEEGQIGFLDKSFRMVLLDLSNTTGLHFTDIKGIAYKIPIQDWSTVIPELEGGEEISNVSMDGVLVYSEKLPLIKIPLHEKDDLSYWIFMMENEKGDKIVRSRIADIKAVKIDKDGRNAWLDLHDQSLFGSLDAGLYDIVFNYLGQEFKIYRLAYLPGFRVDFEQEIYPPQEKGTRKEVKLSIAKPPSAEFFVHQPAQKIREEADTCDVVVDFSADSFGCDLKTARSGGETAIFQLTVNIPKLKWRLAGDQEKGSFEWSDSLEEIWFGEWQKADGWVLEVLCSSRGKRGLQLYMNDYAQELTLPLYGGRAQFKLTSFTDSIRQSSFPVQVFSINLLEDRRKIRAGPVLRVRSKWEVYGFEYFIKNKKHGYSLELFWKEKGKAEQRVIRFWRLEEPWVEPYVQEIPNGRCSIVIDHIEEHLSEGKYLLHFDIDDPWSPRDVEFPNQDKDTFLIDINYEGIYLRSCRVQLVTGSQAVITGEFINAPPLIRAEVSLLGIHEGNPKVVKEKIYCAGGKFSLTLQDNNLGQAAHWLAIDVLDGPSYYRVMALTEGASLECPNGECTEFIKQIQGLNDIGLKLVYRHKGSSKTINLEGLAGRVLTRLLEKRDFSLDLNFPFKNSKLRWKEDEQQVYFDIPTGIVVCSTCGRIFQNDADWYAHNPFMKCKGLEHQFDTIKAKFLYCLNFRDIYAKIFNKYPMAKDDLLVLFSSKTEPFPIEFGLNPIQSLKADELTQIFLKEEAELCNKFIGVLKNEL
ncbi:MAG: hypothetical protein QHH10_11430 [Peptococcaceae bacterium]|jgi:hypothetical protein|nr:hypothetical protein [Peptococcaceae bacterium]MDH7525912.1 hypothetical protein [Peptococcaceae bacterium]